MVIFKYFNGNFVLEIFLWFVIRKTSISSNGNLNNQVHESTQRYHVQVFLHIHEKAITKIYEECDLCHTGCEKGRIIKFYFYFVR